MQLEAGLICTGNIAEIDWFDKPACTSTRNVSPSKMVSVAWIDMPIYDKLMGSICSLCSYTFMCFGLYQTIDILSSHVPLSLHNKKMLVTLMAATTVA